MVTGRGRILLQNIDDDSEREEFITPIRIRWIMVGYGIQDSID